MLTSSHRRTSTVLLLAAILAAPLISSAAPRTEGPQPVTAAAPDSFDLLGRVWSFLRNVWSKSGCHIDPFGLCAPGTAQPPVQTKEGCRLDPNGLCAPDAAPPEPPPLPEADTGCHIDPNGLCVR